jgi:hypothetical protein
VRVAILLSLFVAATFYWPARSVFSVFVGAFVLTATRLAIAVRDMMNPTKFIDTTTSSLELQQELRPWTDAILHVLLFQWQIFGTESLAFCNLLESLNRGFDTWDIPFVEQGQNPCTEILKYCKSYGVAPPNDKGEWMWSMLPAEYKTMNEFFTRIPTELAVGDGKVVSPCTAVITMFDDVSLMPKVLKNSRFTIGESGIPNHTEYEAHPCFIHYLSPADYHCYHSPMEGTVVELLEELDGPYSVTVKPYVFKVSTPAFLPTHISYISFAFDFESYVFFNRLTRVVY